MFKYKKVMILSIFCICFLTACVEAPDKNQEKWQKIVESSKNSEVNVVYYSKLDFESWLKNSLEPKLIKKNGINLVCEKNKLFRVIPSKEDIETNASNGRYDIILLTGKEYQEMSKKGIMYPNFIKKIPNNSKYIQYNDFASSYVDFDFIKNDAVPFYQTQLAFFYNSDLMFSPPKNLDELTDYLEENPSSLLFPHPETAAGKAFTMSVILSFTDIMEFMEKDLSNKEVIKLALPGLRYLKNLYKNSYAGGSMAPKNMDMIDDLFLDEKIHASLSVDSLHGEKKLMEMEYPDYTRAFNPLDNIATTNEYFAIIPVNSDNKSGAMYVLNEFLDPEVQKTIFEDKNLHGMIVYSKSNIDKKLAAKIDKNSKKNTIFKPSEFVSKKTGKIPEKYWQVILKELEKMR